ncbi:MAG: OsmC family protein [Bacteroidia bacterium]|nr:OsmC family protein [Bacteroidia bacterium]
MSASHIVQTHYTEGMSFETVVNDHSIQLDMDEAGGGNDTGPRPKPLILSALGGCTGIDVVSILNKMHVLYNNFTIEVNGTLSDEHPKVYTHIHIKYLISVNAGDQEKMIKAVNLSLDKYCGVSAMLKKVCPVTSEIIYR